MSDGKETTIQGVFKVVEEPIRMLGRGGVSKTYYLTPKLYGVRVNVFSLDGVSITTVALIEGDGFHEPLTTHCKYSRTNPSDAVVESLVISLIEYGKENKIGGLIYG